MISLSLSLWFSDICIFSHICYSLLSSGGIDLQHMHALWDPSAGTGIGFAFLDVSIALRC